MICNPAIVGGAIEEATVKVLSSDLIPDPERGVWYVAPDGTTRHADISVLERTIKVMKGTFLFPSGNRDVSQASLTGELEEIKAPFFVVSGANSVLVLVRGDGSINL